VVEAENELAVARLVSTGYEVVEEAEPTPDGKLGVQVVATRTEQAVLESLGYSILDVVVSQADARGPSGNRIGRWHTGGGHQRRFPSSPQSFGEPLP
jgi:hypothetical protein